MWQLHCDKCKKELPIIKKKILGQEKEFYDKGVVNVPFIDIFKTFNIVLCKECALEIENELLKAKLQILENLKCK